MTTHQRAANWYKDPLKKYTHRYWDGKVWTAHVATDGVQSYDEPDMQPEEPVDYDINIVAIDRAGVERDVAMWLIEVAKQVDRRLDLVEPHWRDVHSIPAVRTSAFGLLLGYLAIEYPRAREQLSMVAEVHPSFATIRERYRLDTLIEIARDPKRAISWLSSIIEISSVERMEALYSDAE